MAEPGGRGRSIFRLPRVEPDVAGIVLGAALSLALTFLWGPLASVLGVTADAKVVHAGALADASPGAVLRSSLAGVVTRSVPVPGIDRAIGGGPETFVRAAGPDGKQFQQFVPDVAAWKLAAAAGAVLLVWSVLGGALARVHALRKARDESIPFDEALAYSLGNLGQFVKAPLFTLAAVALFAGLLAACGAVSAVPWAGPVLQLVAQPLSFVFAVIVAVIATGFAFGWPMMTAAVAVERGGSLDAVSRTFSYVWSRPVTFGLSASVVVVVASVADAVCGFVLGVAGGLFASGAGFVDGTLAEPLRQAFRAGAQFGTPHVAEGAALGTTASVWIAWALAALVTALLRGFVLSYLVGGMVDVYLLLREEVDGVGPGEVFVETDAATLGDPVPGEPKPAA